MSKRDEILSRVKKAERRAAAKSYRLRKKGVVTGSIDPRRGDRAKKGMTTRQLQSYEKQLQAYTNRTTQYVAGAQGTPLPAKLVKKYEKTAKKWQQTHDKYWAEWDKKKFLTGQGESDVTVGERNEVTAGRYRREAVPERVRSVKDLKQRIKVMERELSKTYISKRMAALRRNLLSVAPFSTIMDDELLHDIKTMTHKQLEMLNNQTDFVAIYYLHIDTNEDDNPFMTEEQSTAQKHLKGLIRQAKVLHPRGT